MRNEEHLDSVADTFRVTEVQGGSTTHAAQWSEDIRQGVCNQEIRVKGTITTRISRFW